MDSANPKVAKVNLQPNYQNRSTRGIRANKVICANVD